MVLGETYVTELQQIWHLATACTGLIKSPKSAFRTDLLYAIVARSPWRSEVGIVSNEMHHSSHYYHNRDLVRYTVACWTQVTDVYMLEGSGFAMFNKNLFAKNKPRSANAERDFYLAVRDRCLESLRRCDTVDLSIVSKRFPRFDCASDLLDYLETRTS